MAIAPDNGCFSASLCPPNRGGDPDNANQIESPSWYPITPRPAISWTVFIQELHRKFLFGMTAGASRPDPLDRPNGGWAAASPMSASGRANPGVAEAVTVGTATGFNLVSPRNRFPAHCASSATRSIRASQHNSNCLGHYAVIQHVAASGISRFRRQ